MAPKPSARPFAQSPPCGRRCPGRSPCRMRGYGLSIDRTPSPVFASRSHPLTRGEGKKDSSPWLRLTEIPIEPVPLSRRLSTGGGTMARVWPPPDRLGRRRAETCGREIMRIVANSLVTTSLVVVAALAAMPARAANVEAASAVHALPVHPDGASVTRAITADISAGDNTLVLKDFPLTLDPSSLRVEGEAGAKLTIGTIDTRPPRAAPPVNLPELDKRTEALEDERAHLDGAINAATARRKFAERFAEASPAGLGEKDEAR